MPYHEPAKRFELPAAAAEALVSSRRTPRSRQGTRSTSIVASAAHGAIPASIGGGVTGSPTRQRHVSLPPHPRARPPHPR